MNDHDDTQLDAALEALARPEPPADHVASVLVRTAGRAHGTRAVGRGASLRRPVALPASALRPRWILPIAATAVVAIGMTWQLDQQVERQVDAVTAGWDSRPYLTDGSQWGAPQEIDPPVLPPQAYWGMDAFAEFETLRPGARPWSGTQDGRKAGSQGRRTGRQGRRDDDDPALAQVTASARAAFATAAADTSEGRPGQASLPPIELESIVPAPLELPPVAPLDDIALAEIPFAPVVIAPLTEEERP